MNSFARTARTVVPLWDQLVEHFHERAHVELSWQYPDKRPNDPDSEPPAGENICATVFIEWPAGPFVVGKSEPDQNHIRAIEGACKLALAQVGIDAVTFEYLVRVNPPREIQEEFP